MVSAAFSEGIILIASIVVAAGLSTAVLAKVGIFQSAFTVSTENQKQITLTKIKVIYATNSSSTVVNAYVKNIGMRPVDDPASVDVYFGQLGSVQRIPYNNATAPKWVYNPTPTVWQIKDTVRIDITTSSTLSDTVTYMLRVTTPNGISDDYIFSLP
jgi:flagellar protein FlaG